MMKNFNMIHYLKFFVVLLKIKMKWIINQIRQIFLNLNILTVYQFLIIYIKYHSPYKIFMITKNKEMKNPVMRMSLIFIKMLINLQQVLKKLIKIKSKLFHKLKDSMNVLSQEQKTFSLVKYKYKKDTSKQTHI